MISKNRFLQSTNLLLKFILILISYLRTRLLEFCRPGDEPVLQELFLAVLQFLLFLSSNYDHLYFSFL